MSRLQYDYSATAHVVEALGSLDALEAVKAQAAGLDLPPCPFCGGEAVVALGSAYGQPTVIVECIRCHMRTVSTGPGYNYLTERMTTMSDSINIVASRWSRREEAARI